MNTAAVHAAIRFGLGQTPGQDPGSDPARWLTQQLAGPDLAAPGHAAVADAFLALQQDREDRKADPTVPPGRHRARQLFRDDVQALLGHAVTTPTPFRERLVWFWANHFTVSIRHGEVAPLIGSFVQDAIRPHVTGRFTDMLLAVMRHPAMLLYLDNAQSAGAGSAVGARQRRGLNENLARECLELHTVGAAAGYTQADVTELARVLTGWSIEREAPAGFRFRPGRHEPGEKTVMGHRVPEGEEGGVQALAWLAAHPATHRHLATKLVQHVVADTPPGDAVRRIETALRDSGGNLGAAAAELTRLPGAWRPLAKLRTPQELVIAAMRAAGLPPERLPDLQGLIGRLGQPVFGAPFPIGWPDTASAWAAPEAIMRRIDWAYAFAARPELPEPMQLADAALGSLLNEATATAMRRAGSRRDSIALLLASPAFQRR